MSNRQSSIVNRQSLWVLVGLVLLAAAVRFPSLFANSFHGDEALYGSYARLIGTWQDPLLQSAWVDKPPFLFYLQAIFYPILGTPAPFVARLPNFIASILLVPLMARLVWQLYGDEWAGWIAAAFVATSPYTIQFSGTAFLDPMMVFWVVAGLVVLSFEFRVSEFQVPGSRFQVGRACLVLAHSPTAHSPTLAGLFFGLAVVTKFQAGLFLPLVVGVGALMGWRGRDWRRWLTGFVPVILALLLWELARSGQLTLWQGQMFSYGGLRLSWSWELWSRLEQWGTLWQYTVGSPVLGFGLILLLPLFLAFLIQDEDRPTYTDQLFVLFTIAYFLFHWFVAIPAWDRYLLPIVPIIGIILGRFTGRLVGFFGPALLPILHTLTGLKLTPRGTRHTIFALLLLAQLPVAAAAARSDYPIGGNANWDEGTAQVAEWLADEPYGTVLYDHWYGWHWRYYLFNERVYHYWFADSEALLDNLRVFGDDAAAKYLVLPPDPAVGEPIARTLTDAGYTLELVGTTELPDGQSGVSLHRIVTGRQGDAARGRQGEGAMR
ncbi:MAG: phospholipid carrier-dependent glycosyltransferase [Chloroflexi bacterium]|nr:phospholipid carrier-dependent glycosyltransferase [Chloroflexota bacterium]